MKERIDPIMKLNQDGKIPLWMDCEFTALWREARLISIGVVAIDGSFFYGEFTDYHKDTDGYNGNYEFLHDHVFPGLLMTNRPEGWESETSSFLVDPVTGIERSVTHCECKGPSRQLAARFNRWLVDVHDRLTRNANVEFQFYLDCYAYDWVLFNDWLSNSSLIGTIPRNISYIPMDLCTDLQLHGYDPDISREAFIGSKQVDQVASIMNGRKHNSLYDAMIQYCCYWKLRKEDQD